MYQCEESGSSPGSSSLSPIDLLTRNNVVSITNCELPDIDKQYDQISRLG